MKELSLALEIISSFSTITPQFPFNSRLLLDRTISKNTAIGSVQVIKTQLPISSEVVCF